MYAEKNFQGTQKCLNPTTELDYPIGHAAKPIPAPDLPLGLYSHHRTFELQALGQLKTGGTSRYEMHSLASSNHSGTHVAAHRKLSCTLQKKHIAARKYCCKQSLIHAALYSLISLMKSLKAFIICSCLTKGKTL